MNVEARPVMFPLSVQVGECRIKGLFSTGEVSLKEKGRKKALTKHIRELEAAARKSLDEAVIQALRTNTKFRSAWAAWMKAELASLEESLQAAEKSHCSNHERRSFINSADSDYDASENALTANILRSHPARIRMLRKAICKIQTGKYGTCEECGQAISVARLQAAPGASHCIECAKSH